MKRFLAFAIAFGLLLSLHPSIAEGGKKLPQARGGKGKTTGSVGSSLGISPRLRGDRKALLVSFSNVQNAQSISYTLLYQTNGQEEGAIGSVNPSQGTATRELLFGTCSRNVCRYHSNITNMKLEVVAKLKSGKTQTRRYRIRV